MQFLSTSFEEQKTKFENMLKLNKDLRKDNETLKQRVQVLETKLDSLEIKEKANNLIIVGVPKQVDCDTHQITEKILKSLKIEINRSKILDSFRLKKEGDGPILVKLSEPHIRNEVIKTVKKLK